MVKHVLLYDVHPKISAMRLSCISKVMIDLHSHILPNIDDGAKDIEMSVNMARIAVDEGTTVQACTPHFNPGMYDTTINQLVQGYKALKSALLDENIDLKLAVGGDVHISFDLLDRLEKKKAPCLHSSKFFLFEPSHHVMQPGMLQLCQSLISNGYKPILTHPERLTWIERNFEHIKELHKAGVLIQLTAASVTGDFGKHAKYWSDKMFDEGMVDIIASDAHNLTSRRPGLAKSRKFVEENHGVDLAKRIFETNPKNVLLDHNLAEFRK